MSVAPTTTETVYQLVGANLGPFATVWPYSVADDVKVYLDLGAGIVPLDVGPDYTLIGLTPLTDGGEVTLDGTLLPGGGWPANLQPDDDHIACAHVPTIVLRRETPDGQPSVFGEGEGFSPEACEAALDNLSRQIQEIDTVLTRTLRMMPGEDASFFPLDPTETGRYIPDEIVREDTLLGFDHCGVPTLYAVAGFQRVTGAVGSAYIAAHSFLGGTPAAASETLFQHTFKAKVRMPADFGIGGYCRIKPVDGDQVCDILNEALALIGHLTIAQTTGAMTALSSTGDPVDFDVDATMIIDGNAAPDSAMANVSISARGVIIA